MRRFIATVGIPAALLAAATARDAQALSLQDFDPPPAYLADFSTTFTGDYAGTFEGAGVVYNFDYIFNQDDFFYEPVSGHLKLDLVITDQSVNDPGPCNGEYHLEGSVQELAAFGHIGIISPQPGAPDPNLRYEGSLYIPLFCTADSTYRSFQVVIVPQPHHPGGSPLVPDPPDLLEGTFSAFGRTYMWTIVPLNETITVNSTTDRADLIPGDEICSTGETLPAGAGDIPECTLRAAIEEAETRDSRITIAFNIEPAAPASEDEPIFQTIPVNLSDLGPLPEIDFPIIIDGTTQPGYDGTPLIILSGTLAGPDDNGLHLSGGDSTVRGLEVSGFGGAGILLSGPGANKIERNIIGSSVAPDEGGAGNDTGVRIENSPGNTIGGPTAEERNVIAYNRAEGVMITGAAAAGNMVAGNLIGLTAGGEEAPNATGVFVLDAPGNTIGSSEAQDLENIISGNLLAGVEINGAGASGNRVSGNVIGANLEGTAPMGNGEDGVILRNAPENSVGGSNAGDGNIIVGNERAGVAIVGAAAEDNEVLGNYIGVHVTTPMGNGNGVTISNSPGNYIGGEEPGDGNIIASNVQYGVVVQQPLAVDNRLLGNYIGLHPTEDGEYGNGSDGVVIRSPVNTIGEAGAGNVIGGNGGDGIKIEGTEEAPASGNRIFANVIGQTDGPNATGNGGNGVHVIGASNTAIGGAGDGEGNVIGGNAANGVLISGEEARFNVVAGNLIGVMVDGVGDTSPIGNGESGVYIDDAYGNEIGDAAAGGGNVISGNGQHGVAIAGSEAVANRVRNNTIGLDADGLEKAPNGNNGVYIRASANSVGGVDSSRPGVCGGECNAIAGNTGAGVRIEALGFAAQSNLVAGNVIGVANTVGCMLDPLAAELCKQGNGGPGVRIVDGARNQVGGALGLTIAGGCTGQCNLIAHNNGGIEVTGEPADRNEIVGNALVENGIGIDLGANGFTENDADDDDAGPNQTQNFPEIDLALEKDTAVVLGILLDSTPSTGFTVHVYASAACNALAPQAQFYLGAASAVTNEDGEAARAIELPLPPPEALAAFITMTATDSAGSTSELTPCTPMEPAETEVAEAGARLSPAGAGPTLIVADGRSFSPGDLVEVGSGGNLETGIVAWVESSGARAAPQGATPALITFNASLQFAHAAGEPVVNLGPDGAPVMRALWGDIDCRNGSDAADVIPILLHVAGVDRQPAGCPGVGDQLDVWDGDGAQSEELWGDLDCSGEADAGDALAFLRVQAGLDDGCREPDAPIFVRPG